MHPGQFLPLAQDHLAHSLIAVVNRSAGDDLVARMGERGHHGFQIAIVLASDVPQHESLACAPQFTFGAHRASKMGRFRAVIERQPRHGDRIPHIRWRPEHVRHHPSALVEIDQHDRVRHPVSERGMRSTMVNTDCIDDSVAGQLLPAQRKLPALRTNGPRIPHQPMARFAALHDQLVFLSTRPERRGHCARLRYRERLAHSVASVPRITVDVADNTPPVPCASAVCASATCRSPQSPRNCRVASTSRKAPNAPGWV